MYGGGGGGEERAPRRRQRAGRPGARRLRPRRPRARAHRHLGHARPARHDSFGYQLTADVPADRLVPAPYEEISAETMLPVSHILWAGVWLGMARSAVDTARRFVRAAARKASAARRPPRRPSSALVAEAGHPRAAGRRRGPRLRRASPTTGRRSVRSTSATMNNLKVLASDAVADIVARGTAITGIAGFRNDGR